MKGIVISVALLLVGLSGASAQSLADVAEKEKERREALGSTKVETHDESTLAARRRAMPPSRRPTDVPAAGTEPASTAEPSEEGEEGLDVQLRLPSRAFPSSIPSANGCVVNRYAVNDCVVDGAE